MVEVLDCTWGQERGISGGGAAHSYLDIPLSWNESKKMSGPLQ